MNPVVLAYELYGLIITVGMGCMLLGVTAMRLPDDLAGHGAFHLRIDIFTIAVWVVGLFCLGFRIRSYVNRLLRAAQAH